MSTKHGNTVFVVCLLSSVFSIVFATLASEQESESVEVTFYQMTDLEWSISESAFKTLMAAEAATYCASNSDCGVAAGFGFTAYQVGIYSGPTVESKSLKIKFYIEFPSLHILSSSSNTTYVINSATTSALITSLRSAVESAVGHEITYIEDEFYSIDPDAQLNTIIIPAAFGVLFLMIVLMIILHVWSKQREKAEREKQKALAKEKRRKKSSRVKPVLTIEHEKEGKQSDNLCDLEPAFIKPASSLSTTPLNSNQAAAVRNNVLPPLPNVPLDSEKKKKEEREKKEKRKQKRIKRQQQQESEQHREEEKEEEKSPSEEKIEITMEVSYPPETSA